MRAAHDIKGIQNNNQLDTVAVERERELLVSTELRGGTRRARFWGSRLDEEVNLGRAAMACTRMRPRVGGQDREAGESTEATDVWG